jgi:hypothetical protein
VAINLFIVCGHYLLDPRAQALKWTSSIKKITAIRFNGENTNASSVCDNRSFAVGDLADAVFTACGNPSHINRTFVNRKVESKTKPVTWTYNSDPYQPAFRLIFLDGSLRAIE